MQVAAEGADPGTTTVSQAMSPDVLYCFEGESVEEVSEKMRGWWVRRLPVVSRDKRLIGIVSLGDLTSLKGRPRTKKTSRRAPGRFAKKGRATRRPAAAA
jgi:CBS-domain-containing membrane protein